MDTNQAEASTDRAENTPTVVEVSQPAKTDVKAHHTTESSKDQKSNKPKPKSKSKNQIKNAKKSKTKAKNDSSSDDDSSSDSSTDTDTENTEETFSDSSSEDSEEETDKQRKKRRLKEKRAKAKALKRRANRKKTKKQTVSDTGSDSDTITDYDSDDEFDNEDDIDVDSDNYTMQHMRQLQQQLNQLQFQSQARREKPVLIDYSRGGGAPRMRATRFISPSRRPRREAVSRRMRKKISKASKLDYKRVDQLWDNSTHNWKLNDTIADEESSEYDQYVFNVRRRFDWEGKYQTTVVDIKSNLLKESLNEVMDGVKGVSLVEETPVVDPNLLFLYLEDLRKHMKVLKAKVKGREKMKRKIRKRNETKIKHIKVLLKYLDKDYAAIKKTLYPMLDSGLISFDLLWALYKPNTLAYTTTYGTVDEPRVFKIELAEKEISFMKGEWYNIEGRYLEYDGKIWGMGTMDCEVPSFKGARKITSLACYPLQYHKDEPALRNLLISRGKKFVSLQGVHYRSHEGLAYYKKKRQIVKVNINGRVMVDPAIHRRILPNYQVSTVKPKDDDDDDDDTDDDSDSDEERCECCGSDEEGQGGFEQAPRTKVKIVLDEKRKPQLVEVPIDSDGYEVPTEKLEEIHRKETEEENLLPVFTDEEYLIASPVVLGFAFADKLWLEFTVSGIKGIEWNDGAYESLVLEDNTKEIVKALVESHKYHPAESIDDVIQGKGKGLVAVLHGPPGTGKTLTAEGISELLKCPLYMVSAGELGTDPRTLEGELQKILDIAHAWGAVLLLDEADVFLEKRTIQDIHRNALVSIFLRLLEYFQGILFLTTNRVETFDDAFQSRIHIALRYGELSLKAKKAVFKLFIERVRVLENIPTMPFKEDDFMSLAKHNLNGRQIKNTVRTAQALAVNKGEPLGMDHIRRVLDVLLSFDRDLKGGTGYVDAMRQYM